MHEYSKRIAEHIKSCYGDLSSMKLEELCELEKWAKVIKDLTEYDVNKRAIEAMDEAKEEEKLMDRLSGERMGYRGRDSRGRFVHRSGRGRSAGMGYTPYLHMIPGMDDMYDDDYMDMIPENYRMGYSDGRGGNYVGRSDGRSRGEHYGDGMGYSHEGQRSGSRRGETYDRYRDNRRHYTETKDAGAKHKMDESMKEYMDDAMDSMKEMWKDADPQLRQTMKADLTKLVQQLQ